MSHKHAVYAELDGHITAFETTDRETALDVASALHAQLEGDDPSSIRPHFEQHVDDPGARTLSYTRPDLGDFAVSVTLAEPYKQKALPNSEPTYLLLAQTRNSARQISSLNGSQRLQDATASATKDILK